MSINTLKLVIKLTIILPLLHCKHMKIIKTLIIIIIASSTYANSTNHKTFVYSLKQQVDDILMRESKEDRHKKLQEIIQDNVDLKRISRFVIGKYWALTTEEKRQEFIKEHETYFTRLCIKILPNYIGGGEMMIMGVKEVGDGVYIVNIRFADDENEGFTNIDFKIIENKNSFLISDIIVSGMSITINQRTQFNEKIDTYGIASVIEELKYNNNL